jgi:hypothetical protein
MIAPRMVPIDGTVTYNCRMYWYSVVVAVVVAVVLSGSGSGSGSGSVCWRALRCAASTVNHSVGNAGLDGPTCHFNADRSDEAGWRCTV